MEPRLGQTLERCPLRSLRRRLASVDPDMAYQSLYRKYRPQRFAEVVGQAARHRGSPKHGSRRARRPRLPLLRAARHRQDDDRAPARQGAQLHGPRAPTATRAACATTASASPTGGSSTSSSSTPRPTTASTPCATSPRACTSGSVPTSTRQGVPDRRGAHAEQRRVERAAEDARGTAGARGVRARDDRRRRRCCRRSGHAPSTSTSRCYSLDEILGHLASGRRAGRRSRPSRRRSRSSPAPRPARCATRCRCSTRRSRTARSTSTR